MSTTEAQDNQAQYIYEPIQSYLDQVTDSINGMATEAGVSQEGLVEHAVGGGGKKVRPAVTLLAAGFHPHDHQITVSMATGVELLHIATLVHDDTVDSAEMRRGRATISTTWGGNVAVLLGDYLFAVSATFVCDTGNVRAIRRFAEAIMELASGQLSEHFSAHDWHQTRVDYERRIYNKTASLFCTACETGALLSGAPEESIEALRSYAYNLGMAFQIMDDILDFQGTEAELGKPVGNDLLQGTLTLPSLLFAERYPNDPVIKRLRTGEHGTEELQRVVQMIRNSSAMQESLQVAGGFRDQALEALQSLESNRSRRSLEELTNYVTDRRS